MLILLDLLSVMVSFGHCCLYRLPMPLGKATEFGSGQGSDCPGCHDGRIL